MSYVQGFEIFDSYDGAWIDRNLTLDRAIDMLRHYHTTRKHCTYGIRSIGLMLYDHDLTAAEKWARENRNHPRDRG